MVIQCSRYSNDVLVICYWTDGHRTDEDDGTDDRTDGRTEDDDGDKGTDTTGRTGR